MRDDARGPWRFLAVTQSTAEHAGLAFPAASAGSAVLLKRTQGAKSANNCQLGVCVLHPLLAELALFW